METYYCLDGVSPRWFWSDDGAFRVMALGEFGVLGWW